MTDNGYLLPLAMYLFAFLCIWTAITMFIQEWRRRPPVVKDTDGVWRAHRGK